MILRSRSTPLALVLVLGVAAGALLRVGQATAQRGATSQVRSGPDSIRVGLTSSGSTRITRLDLEEYIARVVAAEGEARAADAAQQALAIAARTFALANLQRHRRENYDVCDTTHCQVLRAATPSSRRAAEATAGRVLVHDGEAASIFYSASCGGHSELASEVWPGAVDYGAVSQRDEACRDEPKWTSDIRVSDIERALRVAGHRGSRLRDLRVVQRNASHRVARLRVDGFTPAEITGHDFRMAIARAVGWQQMKSTAFEVRRTSAGYRFTGQGFGHGVGLCVIGAGQRALTGSNANEILTFYFPKLRIEAIGAGPTMTAGRPPPASPAPVPAADPRPDLLMALPASEESERAEITQLIRSARDQIAAKTGVAAPASIRVTVHPTVEAFGRATGQPWWVSGATEGANVDLVPIAMLRQRAQLERTIRHEVAHVLVDTALAGRPLWVREGAAQYFASPADAITGSLARGGCPADFEFLRPLSAGAHRSAFVRAESCFRRALSNRKHWREVK
jgi:stage II sporulation protein D